MGKLFPVTCLPWDDLGLQSGQVAFEVVRVYRGRPFLWAAHLQRLQYALDRWGLGLGHAELTRAAAHCLHSDPAGSQDGSLRVQVSVTGRYGVQRGELSTPPSDAYDLGIQAVTRPLAPPLMHRDLAAAKLASYAGYRDARRAVGDSADEVIALGPGGEVLEGTSSAVAMVHQGVIITPPPSLGILPSVTLQHLLALAAHAGLPIHRRVFFCHDLYGAHEAFIVSSLRELVPLKAVDGAPLPTERPVIGALRRRYQQSVREAQSTPWGPETLDPDSDHAPR